MSQQSATAKKPRSTAQLAANQQSSERAKKAREAALPFLVAHGFPTKVPFFGIYESMKIAGKSDEEIDAGIKERIEEMKQGKQNKVVARSRPTTPAAAAAAAVATPGAATPRTKTALKEAADKAQVNTAQKFKNRNLKAYPKAVSYYIAEKKVGKNDEAIFAEIKARPNLQMPPIRTKKNNTVSPLASSTTRVANKTVMNKTVSNKGMAKGSYICEKCRYVSNNTTRKNNSTKKNTNTNTNTNEYFAYA